MRNQLGLVLAAMVGVLAMGGEVLGQTFAWDGGASGTGTSWNSANNWVGDVLPSSGANLVFNSRNVSGAISSPMSVSSSRTVGLITFDHVNSRLPAVLNIDTNGSGGTTARTLTIASGITLTDTKAIPDYTGSVIFNATNNGTLNINMSGNNTFQVDRGTLDLRPVIGETGGSRTLTKSGNGILVLGGANTFTGQTNITAGSISVTNASALQNSTVNSSVTDGVTFGLLTTATFGGITGSSNLNINGLTLLTGGLSIGNNNASTTYSGSFSGIGALVKAGSGTLTLASTNNHLGGTNVDAGTLLVNGTGGTGTGAVTINGGTLGGTGSITGATTISGNGTILGGAGTSVNEDLNTGALTFQTNGTIRVVAGNGTVLNDTTLTGASQVVATSFNRNSGALVKIQLTNAATDGLNFDGNQSYTRRIATFTSSNIAPGTYVEADNVFQVAGTNFTVNPGWQVVVGSSSIDVIFTPVPEPGTLLALGAAGLGLLGAYRRYRTPAVSLATVA